MKKNILNINSPIEFRNWLENNHSNERECYLLLKRGKPNDDNQFYYLDAVYVALCFGWIDSTLSKIDGITYQRFSPRGRNSHWTELNKERCRYLIKNGLMTESGLSLYEANKEFIPNPKVIDDLINAGVWDDFCKLPQLYQRIRLSNLDFYSDTKSKYDILLKNTIQLTKKGQTGGLWNDFGRLLDY